MEKVDKKQKRTTFSKVRKVVIVLLLLSIVLDLIISMFSIYIGQKQLASYVQSLVSIKEEQLHSELSQIKEGLSRVIMENEELLQEATNTLIPEIDQLNSKRKLINSLKYSFGGRNKNYHFFFFLQGEDALLRFSQSNSLPQEEMLALHTKLLGIMQEGTANATSQWNIVQANKNYYAMHLQYYQGNWIGCYFPVQELFTAITVDDQGLTIYPILLTEENQIISKNQQIPDIPIDITILETGVVKTAGIINHWTVVKTKSRNNINFSLLLAIKGYGGFMPILMLQSVLLLAVIFTIGMATAITIYSQKKVIIPVKRFTEGFSEREQFLALAGSNVAELEGVNIQFRGLLNEVEQLKIVLYEQQLDQQKMQMDYMKTQIRPHFFLNNLNLIYSMAQKGETEEIKQLSHITVEYLRYIFKSNVDFVLIRDEIEHLQNLFAIMNISRNGSVEGDVFQDPATLSCTIPPLILQTFVENSFKYAIMPYKKLSISVVVSLEEYGEEQEGQQYVSIFVQDNGLGFSQDVLDVWDSNKELPQQYGSNIGIANSKKRIFFAYGEQAKVRLYNSPLGGAVIELELPYTPSSDEAESVI